MHDAIHGPCVRAARELSDARHRAITEDPDGEHHWQLDAVRLAAKVLESAVGDANLSYAYVLYANLW